MTPPAAAPGSWTDVLAQGRLPLFALICLGVWLNAADALVTTTLMPTVGHALGGYAYFGWATAGYLLGSVMAGASAGLLAQRFGLRSATAATAVVYAAGCALSAWAPDMGTFLAGRVLQGIGGGWVAGFCSVAIGLLFPDRLVARVYAAITGIWGIATLVGPMIGGGFADAGAWRWVFWLFAAQGVGVGAAALFLLPKGERGEGDQGIAWGQLGLIALAVCAIGAADLAGRFSTAAILTLAGAGILLATVWLDAKAKVRLLPKGSGNLRTIPGSAYAAMFLTTAAAMGYSVYGPAILQTLRGFSALFAGYVIAAEAVGWTIAGLLVSHLTGGWPNRLMRLGSACVVLGLAICALAFRDWPLPMVVAGGATMGAGFGLSWAFMAQKLLAALPGDERAIGSAAINTVRMTGAAVGAAASAALANLLGFAHGISVPTAQAGAVWVFVAALPVALAGMWAIWRLTGRALRVHVM
jgi:MFS family permease